MEEPLLVVDTVYRVKRALREGHIYLEVGTSLQFEGCVDRGGAKFWRFLVLDSLYEGRQADLDVWEASYSVGLG